MQDRPSAIELLEALAAFLSERVVPHAEGAHRFHAVVAANVAGIVAREIRLGPQHTEAECRRLCELFARPGPAPAGDGTALVRALNEELCRRIAAGEADADPWRRRVLDHLRQTVAEKLAIDNPRFDTRRR